ncbi:MAG: hypothetical protein ABWX73_07650 [Marmoricola sp.]
MAAPVATALAVGVGVLTSGFTPPADTSSAAGNVSAAARPAPAATTEAADRTLGTSRSVDRVPLVDNRVPKATGRLWTTAALDLRVEPREKSRNVGLVKSGKRVAVTGKRLGAYSEVIVGRATRWVTSDYLSKNKTPEVMGLSNAPCPDGSGIEGAIQPAAVKVYRAACAAFPELTTYGGQDGHGEHVNGEAIDFMVPNASVGQRLADFLYAHHAQLDLFDIIWSQHIWTIERAGEGFRSMSDRGSATANHYDHVHIKIN